MNDRYRISRRAFAGGALLLAVDRTPGFAQGFAGLGMSGDGFAPVVPGKVYRCNHPTPARLRRMTRRLVKHTSAATHVSAASV